MANALGTLSSGTILTRALELVFTKRPILSKISLDLSAKEANKGDTVKSRIFTVPTVGNFPSAATDVTTTDVPVTIDQAKQVRHTFTSAELSSTKRNLVDEAAKPIAVAIANHMVDTLAALWTPTNFANETVEAVADADYVTLTKLRGALTGRGASDDGRIATVNGTAYGNMLVDPLCNRAAKSTGADPIANGELSQLAGFETIFEYPSMPTANNLIGFAGTRDSLVLATRLPADPREVLPGAPVGGAIGVITEPTTGLSIMAVEWIDLATLSANVMLVWLYGVAKGNANNGQRLVSAATT